MRGRQTGQLVENEGDDVPEVLGDGRIPLAGAQQQLSGPTGDASGRAACETLDHLHRRRGIRDGDTRARDLRRFVCAARMLREYCGPDNVVGEIRHFGCGQRLRCLTQEAVARFAGTPDHGLFVRRAVFRSFGVGAGRGGRAKLQIHFDARPRAEAGQEGCRQLQQVHKPTRLGGRGCGQELDRCLLHDTGPVLMKMRWHDGVARCTPQSQEVGEAEIGRAGSDKWRGEVEQLRHEHMRSCIVLLRGASSGGLGRMHMTLWHDAERGGIVHESLHLAQLAFACQRCGHERVTKHKGRAGELRSEARGSRQRSLRSIWRGHEVGQFVDDATPPIVAGSLDEHRDVAHAG